jgi:tyrosyl-tRNA synthetase
MNLKKEIAHAIVALFWSAQEADNAQQQFESLFQKKDLSQAQEVVLPADSGNPLWIVDLLKAINAVASSSEVKRLIESGAIQIDGKVISDFKALIMWRTGMTLKVGKHRIYKIT